MGLSMVLKSPLPSGLDKGLQQARSSRCLVEALFEDSIFDSRHSELFCFLQLSHSEINPIVPPPSQIH